MFIVTYIRSFPHQQGTMLGTALIMGDMTYVNVMYI